MFTCVTSGGVTGQAVPAVLEEISGVDRFPVCISSQRTASILSRYVPVRLFQKWEGFLGYTRATTLSGEVVVDISTSNRSELASMNSDGSDQKRLTPRSITAEIPSIVGGL